jgi:hypothetical protein
MSNVSTTHKNWAWATIVPYASSKLSAEWIEEAPSSAGGILPLADFGTATITDLDVGSGETAPAPSLATNGILMEDPWGQTANVSDPNGDSFSACWGFLAFTAPCPP